jgi:hypothetical protein
VTYDFDIDIYHGCNFCKGNVDIRGGDTCPICGARFPTSKEVAAWAED